MELKGRKYKKAKQPKVRTTRKVVKTEIELSPIEKLLLPVSLTSNIGGRNKMIYTAIRKYDDLSVPDGKALDVAVSRYFHSEIVLAYLNVVKEQVQETGVFKGEKKKGEIEIEESTSKEGIIKSLLEISRDSNSDAIKVEARKAIATINGYTKQQEDKKTEKKVYAPITCYECPMYKEKIEKLKEKENDNSL